jgi:hypothetical protein
MQRAALSVAILVGTSLAAWADTGPVRVIPGKPGVPVIINGRDASYAVVEGDWGLAKHFVVQPTVYGGWDRYELPPVPHYYPSLGRKPGYGRLEIEPPANRKLPHPAESFHKSYSAQSAPPALQQPIPYDPPAVIVAPPDRRGFQQFRR